MWPNNFLHTVNTKAKDQVNRGFILLDMLRKLNYFEKVKTNWMMLRTVRIKYRITTE